MVGRSVDQNGEIQANIKARSKLNCSLKKLMTELSAAYGTSCVSYVTVGRSKNKFESCVESIKMHQNQVCQNLHLVKKNVPKKKEIIEGDVRFTVRDIARKVGISLSTVHLILKQHWKVRKTFARWVPHLLTDEQNRQWVKVAKKLLQMFQNQFTNVVTGDENWVYYFQPVRKVSNKIWATKHSRRPIIPKRSLSAKVWYAIFFSGERLAIKVPAEKGKKYHRKVLQRHSTVDAEKYYQKLRPVTGFKHISLLHDNVTAHTSAIVTAFLKKEKVTVLLHLPYSLDLALCDFFCFQN